MLDGSAFRPGFSRWICTVATFVATLLVSLGADALVLQAPIGGAPISLPSDRVLCGQAPSGWAVDTSRRALRPTLVDAPGREHPA